MNLAGLMATNPGKDNAAAGIVAAANLLFIVVGLFAAICGIAVMLYLFFRKKRFRETALRKFRKATVLAGKLEVMIFEEAVHEDDELAHAGGQGDEGFLACGAQAQVKLF